MNIDRYLGEWNPQFIREVKGRLKPRNLIFTVATSLVVQALVALTFLAQIPEEKTASYSRYCIQQGDFTCGATDWHRWWMDMFQVWNWILPIALILIGVYVLVSDLAKEERRGTLNFIRLSPQSSQKILLGKILGVPILTYLGVGLILPFYFLTAIAASVSWAWVISYSLIVICGCFFFYSSALLLAFLGAKQPGVGSLAAAYFISTILAFYFHLFSPDSTDSASSYWQWQWQWYGLKLSNNIWLFQTFLLVTTGVGCYWIWQALNRRYNNPTATILSKKQSYGLVACFQLWLLGCVVNVPDEARLPLIIIIMGLNLFGFLALVAAVSPHFQTCIDWARYRHTAKTKPIVRDLIWGEKSPALVAIAINLGITLAIWGVWVMFWPIGRSITLVSLLICTNLILIYAAIAQLMLLSKSPKRSIWTIMTVCTAMGLPPLALWCLFANDPTAVSGLWLFSTFGASWAVLPTASTTSIFLSILGQWAIFGLMAIKLTRQLNQAGTSASKALLTGKAQEASQRLNPR